MKSPCGVFLMVVMFSSAALVPARAQGGSGGSEEVLAPPSGGGGGVSPAPQAGPVENQPLRPRRKALGRFPGRRSSQDLGGGNLKVSFRIKSGIRESSGNFVVRNAMQMNYVVGGDTPFELEGRQKHAIEFKKYGTIVNCLAVSVPGTDKVQAQFQFELSGPQEKLTSFEIPRIESFQLQTEVLLTKGLEQVLVDEPDRRIEVRVEDAK